MHNAMQKEEMEQFAHTYCDFMDKGKTERECFASAVRLAESAGYRPIGNDPIKAGDRVYVPYMEKTIAFFHVGSAPLEQGMNILAAHIDSPRLDVKPNPIYEEEGFAYLDLHYYGGIKKYQWVTTPLAIHGVAVLKTGEKKEIVIGEKETDPVLCITDILPHLSEEQLEKKAAKFIDGEAMDLLIGSGAADLEEKNPVKAKILQFLWERYGIEEEDFFSVELEIVPAGRIREAGLDRSLLFGYGHDDRSCAYACLAALLKQEKPERTACCLLVDKEEIGSIGAVGAQSEFFRNALAELLARMKERYCDLEMRRCLQNSMMLSCDVTAAYDPLYSSVFEKRSCAMLGKGVNFNKYTGAKGKNGANDTSPEFIAMLRRILGKTGIQYQITEIGKVDVGGGGTIACFFARYGMQVIDCGVPVLSMHSPGEVISKTDLYETWRCYHTFLQDAEPIA